MEIIYVAVSNGLKFVVSTFPTVCTVGYNYVVGFADFLMITPLLYSKRTIKKFFSFASEILPANPNA